MKTLSREAEQRVIDAVKQAIALVDDDGLTPDAAIEKVARAQHWGPDMVRFAGYAYNTGRQTAQREASSGILAKLADFPLVDPEKVIQAIYPDTVKTAADLAVEMVSPEYAKPSAWLTAKAASDRRAELRRSPLVKAAAAVEPEKPVPSWDAILAVRHNLRKAAEAARHQAAAAYDQMTCKMAELAGYFRRSPLDRVGFPVFAKTAALLYGEPGERLCDWLKTAARIPDTDVRLTKAAIDADPKLPAYLLADACVLAAKAVAEKRAAHTAAAAALEAYDKEHQLSFNAGSRPQGKSAGIKDIAIGTTIGRGVLNTVDKVMGAGTPKDETGPWMELEDPGHDAQLRAIRTQATLADLMGGDEVLRGYPAPQVLAAYNEVAQMAPRAAQQPMALRAVLRRQLQGHTEPFEVKELTDLEKGLKDTAADTPSTRILRNAPESIIG